MNDSSSAQETIYCVYCGKPIEPGTELIEEGLEFCNALCRYAWRSERGAMRPPGKRGSSEVREEGTELVMDVPAALFKGRGLCVRSGFWSGSRVFVDGQPLKRLSRKYFTKRRSYRAKDNAGNVVDIHLRVVPFDPVPRVEVDGHLYKLARRWRWYEYVWILFPLMLGMQGGAIGGFLGGAAAATNGRIFRTQPTTFRKIVFSTLALLSAVSLYLTVVLGLTPFMEEMKLHQAFRAAGLRVEPGNPSKIAMLTSHPWKLEELRTESGRVEGEPWELLRGAKRYFMADGNFSQVYRNGTKTAGFWHFDSTQSWILLRVDTLVFRAELLQLTPKSLNLKTNGVEMMHDAD